MANRAPRKRQGEAVYIRECAFWSKRIKKHTYQTDSLKSDYCSQRCYWAAEEQRQRDRKFLAEHPRWTLEELGTMHLYLPGKRRKIRDKPPIAGSVKYKDAAIHRKAPSLRCETCGALIRDCECKRGWLD